MQLILSILALQNSGLSSLEQIDHLLHLKSEVDTLRFTHYSVSAAGFYYSWASRKRVTQHHGLSVLVHEVAPALTLPESSED